METLFTGLVGGARLRDRVLEVLRDAAARGGTDRVDIHIMTFSFTDEAIAGLLAEVARSRPNVTIRIIADWSQGAAGAGRQVRRLAQLGLSNLVVRFKNDQPYVWDATAGRIRWSYHASRGLLHHKTLMVRADGQPLVLVCGSFNWTGKAANSYENLLVLGADNQASIEVMTAVEREFEAMWSDGGATLSPEEVRAQYWAIFEQYRRHPSRPAADIVVGRGCDVARVVTAVMADRPAPVPTASGRERQALIAFCSRSPDQSHAEAGYSEENRARRFDLAKPSGKEKRVPLTLTTLALDTIGRAQPGDRLLVAMYGLSVRVPEYGALLDAARRGVRLQVVLDGHVGKSVIVQMASVAHREGLPIRLRGGSRMMHQKYILHPEAETVLTGTANLSTDASGRHTEHRIMWRRDPAVTAAFVADFGTMWARIPSPFRSRAATAP
jgi:phosphatidylserine/phosphatidylglycerophosphate/cardiolipin synthase-like enzyme